jgi:hypothetical protein
MKPYFLMYLMLLSFLSYSQNNKKISHEISMPLVGYQITNISGYGLNLNKQYLYKQYLYKQYLPNLQYKLLYKDYIIGLSHYYSSSSHDYLNSNLSKLILRSYSVFIGHRWIHTSKISMQSGLGVSYFHDKILYKIFASSLEPFECHDSDSYAALLWINTQYKFNKSISLRLDLRYNPRLRPFNDIPHDQRCPPSVLEGSDPLQLLISQLSLGYSF